MPRPPDTNSDVRIDGQLTVVKSIQTMKSQALQARQWRIDLNRRNRAILAGEQDWSHKQPGQSRDFLPKLSIAQLAFAAVVEQGLVGDDSWFDVEVPIRSQVKEPQIKKLIQCFLSRLATVDGRRKSIVTVVSDAVKSACTDSLMIVKVHGMVLDRREFYAEPGEARYDEFGQPLPVEPVLRLGDRPIWRLSIDLVPDTDYYPDPSGNGLYEIHSVERDVHQVEQMVEAGLYDREVFNRLRQSLEGDKPDIERREDREEIRDGTRGGDRKKIVIDEFWGTLLNTDGTIYAENVVCAVANERFLLRKPEPNPLWHGESPFVAAPIYRVPHSTWHRAIYDDAVRLNASINELFNLMLDGGMASVWGVRQVRTDLMLEPEEVAAGLSANQTIAISDTTPEGVKVVEQVATGEVPPDAFGLLQMLDREFQQSALVNDVRLGNLPPRRVKATEIIESQSGQSVTIDSLIRNIENEFLERVIKKSWLTVLQYSDYIPLSEYEGAVDVQTALTFNSMPHVDKFALFGQGCNFSVMGLSSTLNKARDFQKLVALLQVVSANPITLKAFVERYSPQKVIEQLIRSLGLTPQSLTLTAEEQQQLPAFIEGLAPYLLLATGNQGGSQPGVSAGDETNAEVNANINPTSGLGTS